MHSIRTISAILLVFLSLSVFGQSKTVLSKQLWDRVQKCYSQFEDMDDDGETDYSKIDDSPNGYLEISGEWPTCGCSCNSKVGAYRAANGAYTLLQRESFVCSWENSVSSNREMSEILPENFNLNAFSNDEIKTSLQFPVFYLDVEIPRVGTDTKFSIKLIPFGMVAKGKDLITYDFTENSPKQNGWPAQDEMLYEIKGIAERIKDTNTLHLLLSKEYEKIAAPDRFEIEKTIGPDSWSKFESLENLSENLQIMKEIFDIYTQLDCTSMLMKWDREEARFKLKTKGEKPTKTSFKEFLADGNFWSPMC